MKLLMLCREPRLYSCQRLKKAAEMRGHQMDILDPNRCILKLSQNSPHFEVLYHEKCEDKPYLLTQYDAVLPRFGTSSTQMGCAVLRHFISQGAAYLNSDEAFITARDKWKSLQCLLKAGIAVPSSMLSGNEVQMKSISYDMEAPIILKTLSGSQGIGVMKAETQQSAVSIQEAFKQHSVPVLAQTFIKEAENSDIRCFVIGEQVIATMQRTGMKDEFRANCHRGGEAKSLILSEDEKNIAIRATKAMGLDVAGVDLIRSKRGLLVLEVNASPGLEMIEKTSRLDIATEMVIYLEKKIRV